MGSSPSNYDKDSTEEVDVEVQRSSSRKLEAQTIQETRMPSINESDIHYTRINQSSPNTHFSASHCNRLFVAAFDIGTTFSGYAFSFRDKPFDIKCNSTWVAGSQQLISLKTPTCVLLKPDKEFHSFGFEAENMYSELAEDGKHRGWYLFRRFKMMLYNTKNLQLDTSIEDISGKKMPLLKIFSHTIRFLRDHLQHCLNNQTLGIQPDDVQYIITVPAIWDQKAKQFMRKAAIEAGIKDDQLRIALEPEAASIWCQVDTDQELSGLSKPGSKYMVIDLGGGTADITIHEKMIDGSLKELHKASGGIWGGVQVDMAYLEMLSTVFGEKALNKLKTEQVIDFLDLLRDFETKKRTITLDTEGRMTFKIPAALLQCREPNIKSLQDRVESSKYRGKITLTGDKIRVEKTVALSFFDTVIDALTKHVRGLLSDKNVSKIDAILLVGGFGDCELIQQVLRRTFSTVQLLIPSEAGLAVLKGSVRFGHLPEVISVRVARFTYGWKTFPEFDANRHDENKRVLRNGKYRCSDVFDILVKIGEEIPIGKEVRALGRPASVTQINSIIKIYSSTQEHPKYVTDEGCTHLGTIKVDMSKSGDVDDKRHFVYLTFGSTELNVRAEMINSNKTYETVINCFE